MGDHVLVQDASLLQAGAVSESGISVFSTSELYDEKWRIGEHKTAELLDGIQPCRPSEDTRMAVINYVEGLIRKNFHCKVFPYGSVALKTYLPDGDIDLTAVNNCHGSNKATWAREMCASLEEEKHTHNAGFQVKEVMCIQAKVPVVKCLVGSIIVDISFNQLGGLSTVCFLEEVDRLIGRNHLFKRSIILVKAWCFYESRILGAHHGLLSTYAVETLVLFVLNAFHRSLRGPLEVLFRFLKFFSSFDWNRFCLGIRGPIPLHSVHKMAGESLLDVSAQFLLSKAFLDACTEKYSLCFEGTQGNIFSQKFMNILDPLRPDNNLGGSVNRGNFVRIQKAFAYGAGQLEKLLHSTSHVHLAERMAAFFRNTQKRCRGQRPDSFSGLELCQQVNTFLCDDKASSESNNTEFTAENVVVNHAQLSPSCTGSQLLLDNGELYVQLNGIGKCIKKAFFNKSPQMLANLTTSIDDDTHKAGRTDLFGKDRRQCSLQDLKTSWKRLERRTSATSSTQRKLSCDLAFYNILKFGITLSLVPLLLLKIELQEGMVHLGMQPEKRSPYPIIHYKRRYLSRLGPQGCLPQEDHDLHHQFTGVTNQTKADILRGDLATYLLNLEASYCNSMSCLQEPLLHSSTRKKCSLPIEQESALEGPERPEAVAPPISATMDSMPISDLLAEGSTKSRRGTGAFIPNLVPGFEPDKQCTNDKRGRDRVKTSKTRRKEKLKDRKKQKALLMEGPVHGSFLNSPNGKENIGKLLDTPINITNSLLKEGPVHGSFLNSPNGKENIGGLLDTPINITNSLLMEGPVHGSFLDSPNGKENIGGLLDTPVNISNSLLMEGPVHGSSFNSPNGKENIGGLLDTPIIITNSSSSPVEMIQFGSLSPGLLEGSFQDLHSTNGALDSCKAKLRARKHALCQQSSQGPYQLNEEDFPPLTSLSSAREQSHALRIIIPP